MYRIQRSCVSRWQIIMSSWAMLGMIVALPKAAAGQEPELIVPVDVSTQYSWLWSNGLVDVPPATSVLVQQLGTRHQQEFETFDRLFGNFERGDAEAARRYHEELAALRQRQLDECKLILGSHFASVIHQFNRNALRLSLMETQRDDPSLLSSRELQKALSLTPKQVGVIESELVRFDAAQREIAAESTTALDRNAKERFQRMLAVLDEGQRAWYLEAYGEPIPWHRLADASKTIAKWSQTQSAPESSLIQQPSPQWMKAKRAEYLETTGIEFPSQLDALQMELVMNPLIWDEVGMDERQREQLKVFQKHAQDMADVVRLSNASQLQKLIDGEYDLPADVQEVLLPRQLSWLRQAELQLRLISYLRTFGLDSPEMERKLALTQSQKLEIEKIAEEFDRVFQEIHETRQQRIREARREFARNVAATLSWEQQMRYAHYLGSEYLASIGDGRD